MRATRAALLLALPEPVERVSVLEGAEEWRDPLRAFGVQVVDEGACDLVVAPARLTEVVARGEARMALIVGRPRRDVLRRAGFVLERYLPLPSLDWPTLLVPLDHRRAARYALSALSLPTSRLKSWRNDAAGLAVASGLPMPGELTVACRDGTTPFPVRGAQRFGLPDELDTVFVLGRSVERPAFLVFEHGARTPRWIAKLSYVDRTSDTADERGLRLAAELGPTVAAHAPSFVGSSVVSGWPMSVETAAPGSQLVYVLRSSASRRRKQALVESVASWLVDVAAATCTAGRLDGLLADFAVPDAFAARVDRASLVTPLAGLPATLRHGDLGPEHVIVGGDSFVVLDWEGAERHGTPLTDLAFFLARALPILDGEADSGAYGEGEVFARLFRGESRSAALLRGWLGEGCRASGIEADVLGPLLSLIWLGYLSEHRRHFADAWFGDPALGPGWAL
jgi:hypothetical protein